MKVSYLNDEFFSRLETLAVNLRTSLTGFFGGKHLVRSYGQTVEFADYREYMLGDDIRRIDWNLYSRFEKYFLKLFTDERQMHARVFLDCSASMGKENPAKAAYAVAVTAALGFLSVHNMDKFSCFLLRGGKAENPFGTIRGKDGFFQGGLCPRKRRFFRRMRYFLPPSRAVRTRGATTDCPSSSPISLRTTIGKKRWIICVTKTGR